jgi:hypothetical protein
MLPRHRNHRRALAHVQVVAIRKRAGRRAARILVPTAVRVEAGWDRSDPRAAFINLLGIHDAPLDPAHADRAAAIASELRRISVADAHVGATAQLLPQRSHPITIVSSDGDDMTAVVGNTPVNVVAL